MTEPARFSLLCLTLQTTSSLVLVTEKFSPAFAENKYFPKFCASLLLGVWRFYRHVNDFYSFLSHQANLFLRFDVADQYEEKLISINICMKR